MLFTIGLWHRAGLLKLLVAAPNGIAKCNFVVAKPIGFTNQIQQLQILLVSNTTSYALLYHDCFKVLTDTDLAFIPTRWHASV